MPFDDASENRDDPTGEPRFEIYRRGDVELVFRLVPGEGECVLDAVRAYGS